MGSRKLIFLKVFPLCLILWMGISACGDETIIEEKASSALPSQLRQGTPFPASVITTATSANFVHFGGLSQFSAGIARSKNYELREAPIIQERQRSISK